MLGTCVMSGNATHIGKRLFETGPPASRDDTLDPNHAGSLTTVNRTANLRDGRALPDTDTSAVVTAAAKAYRPIMSSQGKWVSPSELRSFQAGCDEVLRETGVLDSNTDPDDILDQLYRIASLNDAKTPLADIYNEGVARMATADREREREAEEHARSDALRSAGSCSDAETGVEPLR